MAKKVCAYLTDRESLQWECKRHRGWQLPPHDDYETSTSWWPLIFAIALAAVIFFVEL